MIEWLSLYGWYCLGGLLLIHAIFASLLSREVLIWVPGKTRKLKLLLLIWLVPVKGLKWANQKAQLGWNEERKETVGTTSTDMGLMLIDQIFNPGVRHRIEAIQKQNVSVAKKNDQDNEDVENLPQTLRSTQSKNK